MGCQLLGLALGGRTVKLPFGHHGGNHPVRELATGRVLVTSQNHNYVVEESSLPREVEGELSEPANIVLPAVAAVGGIAVPVLLYWLISQGDPTAMRGWAIPAATDIAFALGILMLLGSRVPVSLKLFLVSLAIFDDISAIVIIAVFYSADLSMSALLVSAACVAVLVSVYGALLARARNHVVEA